MYFVKQKGNIIRDIPVITLPKRLRKQKEFQLLNPCGSMSCQSQPPHPMSDDR